MPPQNPQESECWMSDYQYEGPGSTQNGHEFMIHATLEPGANKVFSGIRILVKCKDAGEGELSELTIKDNVRSLMYQHGNKQADKDRLNILQAQRNGCKLAKQWRESGDRCVDTETLPVCTLVFEIVDKSNSLSDVMNLILHPLGAAEHSSLRTLYDFVEPYNSSSKSVVLFLCIPHTLRGSLRQNNNLGIRFACPAPMGIIAHGVHILPPPAFRKKFVNPPIDLLHLIFEEAVRDKTYTNWRANLISFALVCRAWLPALDHLFNDFGQYSAGQNRPDAIRLARSLKANPDLGKRIRIFNPSHFSQPKKFSEATYLAFAEAILTILQRAPRITVLQIPNTHTTIAQKFLKALCDSRDVEQFRVERRQKNDEEYRYVLSVSDILRCMSNWPRLRKVEIYTFVASSDTAHLTTPACSINDLKIARGHIGLRQLSLLTTLSHSTLQHVMFHHISGLTNAHMRIWLGEVGPTLISLTIKFTPLSRQMGEEYAVDDALPLMHNLQSLILEGDVVSELALLRYAPHQPGNTSTPRDRTKWCLIAIGDAPGINAHGFVSALRNTQWTQVSVGGVTMLDGNAELKEEAHKIARGRHIFLNMA